MRTYISDNGYTYTLDSDGDRIWSLPDDWSLDKPIEEMNQKELSAVMARRDGCSPEWSGYYGDWVCTCLHGKHACDSQCSVVRKYNEKDNT